MPVLPTPADLIRDANYNPVSEVAAFAFTFQSAAAANGNGTANYVLGMNTVVVQVTLGGAAATINFEATTDGTNYVAVIGTNVTSGAAATTTAAAGIYEIPCSGFYSMRCRISGYAGPGAVTVAGYGTVTSPMFSETAIINPVAISENVAQWGGNNVVGGEGVTGAGVPRVTLPTDGTGKIGAVGAVTSITNDVNVTFKPTATAANAPTNTSTAALAASLVVKGAAGTLYGFSGYSGLAGGQFIQIHDAAALPADTAVPAVIIWVGAVGSFSYDPGPRGRAFANGIVVCNSTTAATKTIGAANLWVDAQYA